MISRVRSATAKAVVDSALIVQRAAMANAPKETGNLARSIKITGPFVAGRDTWKAMVGPTTVYGRQRELGGHIYPKNVTWMRWADPAGKYGYLHRSWGTPGFAYSQHVYQRPQPYLHPAVDESLVEIRKRFADRIGAAMKGV